MTTPFATAAGAGALQTAAGTAAPVAGAWPGPELSVVIPTFNERDNIRELVQRLEAVLAGRSWEVIFVDDDSADATADLVRELGARDGRIRCVQRIGRRGLSSACIEGMLASSAPYLAVMDADLQHDETLLPRMLDILCAGEVDVVIGSRHAPGGGLGDWSEDRARISRVASQLSRVVLHAPLTDPMSGFFMIKRQAFTDCVRQLSGIGFKILLDLFASSPRPLRHAELPYQFRNRMAGESKLDSRAAWDFLMLVADKWVGGLVPARFLMFTLVGAVGVGVHMAVMIVLFKSLGLAFVGAQGVATLVAMTFNFTLNNVLTYRDMRLRGWHWLRGWVSFVLACSVGGLANVGVASFLFGSNTPWMGAALAGVVAGAVCNYALTSVYTWRPKS
jgi:dolichol-phosphate mannosyltransferase